MTHHHKQESSCCPLCDPELQKADLPFCQPCGVKSLSCPACHGKIEKDAKVCPECGAEIKLPK